MERNTIVGVVLSACLLPLAVLVPAHSVPQSGPAQRPTVEEKFEKVDPYTKGQAEELERAGYVSFGPFTFAEGIKTLDVEETLGNAQVLWVETAHFKLGSTLATYKCPSDTHEEQRLREEIGRLIKKLPRVHRDPGKLDPWLRLHLYAQRLEEQYADFEARFGLHDEDFAAKGKPASPADSPASGSMGPGPYLGQELKFTVLLTEKSSQVARFAKRYIVGGDVAYYRAPLPGGTRFLGTSAQAVRSIGTELDSALHALVATELACNLCDGFRGAQYDRPLWFDHGLGLFYGRMVEERWSVHVPRVSTEADDESWHWEPRIRGLVSNAYVTKWDEMLGWQDIAKLEASQHMCAWSRVAWLMSLEKGDLHGFLMGVSEPLKPGLSAVEEQNVRLEQQKTALQAAFGKSPSELDEAWRKWVLRKYAKR